MNDFEKEEALNLQKEFEWVLHKEVHAALQQIHQVLVECAQRFPVQLYGKDNSNKQDRFTFNVAPDLLKCSAVLTGDSITHAEIHIKALRLGQVVKASIQGEHPWKLQQVQDAANHLQQAIYHIDDVGKNYKFKSSDEVLHILGNILGSLQRGRTSLIVPRKKTIDDLIKSRNMKSLAPNLPEDLAISFYIQSHKLILASYQIYSVQGVMKYDCSHAECTVSWLNEVLVLFTVGLQLCQQLKDKICVFSQYKDFTVGSRPNSPIPA
ncbi:protein rogdi [Onthophagus taurus]|uniref:protein rogdi n=1 Tax=Onthophagus taurus TaxID=166361 RepID=UPI000C20F315|nr:protein rogdi [Onthophagus taurus]